MNLKYSLPENEVELLKLSSTLGSGKGRKCTVITFNRRGALLACGTTVGDINIWDFETQCLAKVLREHENPITSLVWSRNGRKLLSTCQGGELCLWRVAEGTLDYRFVECAKKEIIHASLNPRLTQMCCITCKNDQPFLITVLPNKRLVLKRLQLVVKPRTNVKNTKSKPEINVLGVFAKKGKSIICGSSKGRITELQTFRQLKILKTRKVGKSCVKSIRISRCGKYILINSADRTIRILNFSDFDVLKEFSNIVEKFQWQCADFSFNSEYIIAIPVNKPLMHVYNIYSNSLVDTIETASQQIKQIEFHPTRACVATVSTQGILQVWMNSKTEHHWTSYQIGFEELKQNTWYEEDMEPEDVVLQKRLSMMNSKEEDIVVDIVSREKTLAFSSDEDESLKANPDDTLASELIHLPSIPIPDEELKILGSEKYFSHPTIITETIKNTATYVLSFEQSSNRPANRTEKNQGRKRKLPKRQVKLANKPKRVKT